MRYGLTMNAWMPNASPSATTTIKTSSTIGLVAISIASRQGPALVALSRSSHQAARWHEPTRSWQRGAEDSSRFACRAPHTARVRDGVGTDARGTSSRACTGKTRRHAGTALSRGRMSNSLLRRGWAGVGRPNCRGRHRGQRDRSDPGHSARRRTAPRRPACMLN